jgi:hypothetical protein
VKREALRRQKHGVSPLFFLLDHHARRRRRLWGQLMIIIAATPLAKCLAPVHEPGPCVESRPGIQVA